MLTVVGTEQSKQNVLLSRYLGGVLREQSGECIIESEQLQD